MKKPSLPPPPPLSAHDLEQFRLMLEMAYEHACASRIRYITNPLRVAIQFIEERYPPNPPKEK